MVPTKFLTPLLLTALPQASQAIDAVPEPGLIIYGQVYSQSSPSSTVSISTITWNTSPGGTGTAPTTTSYGNSLPAAVAGNPTYYTARVPFESPTPGGLTLTNTPRFDLMSGGSHTYQVGFLVTPVTGGSARIARIKAVNGVANPGPVTSLPTFCNWTDITTAKRGGTLRLDLIIDAPPNGDAYLTWIGGFMNPTDSRAARTSDADGDGISNEQEYAANTNPLDASVYVEILTFSRTSPTTASVSWSSNAGQSYTLEYHDTLGGGSWREQGVYTGAPGSVTQINNVPVAADQTKQSFRIKTSR